MMRCIIIDDEPNAVDILERYAAKLDFLQVDASFRDPVKALGHLNKEKTDLLFIDINMPDLSGMQLLSSLTYEPLVIFTTAYSEYGAESYNYNAVDYLVKPFLFERFVKAVNKAFERFNQMEKEGLQADRSKADASDILLLKSGSQIHRINKNDVLYFEKDANYIIVHTSEKKILLRGNMADVYQHVSREEFFQVHKSFIINIGLLETIEVHQVTIKG
ncbi:MAG: LytTR family DNA-binding domain-containing protein, partial [Chitinophagaceae bacterium]